MSASGGKTSCRKQILDVMCASPDEFMTATQIKRKIRDYPLSTVSSILAKLSRKGTLIRQKGVGPRGGYGYKYIRVMSFFNLEAELELTKHISEQVAAEIDAQVIDELLEIAGPTFPQDDRRGSVP